MAEREWQGVVAALAAAVRDGWPVEASALLAAGRPREAARLRADHRAATRRCCAIAWAAAAHPVLASPWREAARALTVAAGFDAAARGRGVARRFAAPHPFGAGADRV